VGSSLLQPSSDSLMGLKNALWFIKEELGIGKRKSEKRCQHDGKDAAK